LLASVRTYALLGVEARDVTVEVDVTNGLPAFVVVGLPDAAVRESRERVRAAIQNSGFEFPQSRITASLAPADLRKAGPGFDLAIAAALLDAHRQLEQNALDGTAFAAELALDGSLRPVPGALAMAERAGAAGVERIVVAPESAYEAGLPAAVGARGGTRVVPIERLSDLRALGTDREPAFSARAPQLGGGEGAAGPDLADLRGQPALRDALEVAAAGGHGMLILGPPGAGKSLAARRLPSILPPPSEPEAMEILRIASACGRRPESELIDRPFRAPHHTISPAGLVGGGNPPRAGEVTMAHGGVLFLDELGEFSRAALEALRQPLEDGSVTIARVRHSVRLPSRFLLVAASNPCPCGHGEDRPECRCSPGQARRYRNRISGALADRIDLALTVEQPSADDLSGSEGEASAAVRARVVAARGLARRRQGCPNAELGPAELRRHARLGRKARAELVGGHRRLGLSGRGHDRVLRVARTVADLRGCEEVEADDVAAALSFRRRNSE
jgi:magnesium chelatase family protein